MDQTKIGKFISQQRKAKNYTQKQLAEKLMISDKTVSKWECGKGFPEVSLLLPLCNELEITVNELLSGEILPEQKYKMKAEETIMKLVEERQESKMKMIMSAVVAGIVVLAGVPLFVISGIESLTLPARIALIIIGFVVIAAGIIVACILDREAGAFECPNCKTRFVPDMKAYVMAPHTITRRKLKCPHCNKRSYCKHVMTKADE